MVAELATRPQNIETLQNADIIAVIQTAVTYGLYIFMHLLTKDQSPWIPNGQTGVMALLRPLLLDVVPTIQQTAALALGRLANYNDDLAEAVVKGDILPQLVYSLAEQNRFYKKAAAFVLRAVGKHSPQLAQAIVDCGALDTLVICLEDFDPGVKEAAAWALGYIARHNAELSQAVVDAGAVPLLVLCIQEPEIALKRIAVSALSDIAKHSPELAQTVVDAGVIAHLAQMILNPDAKLKLSQLIVNAGGVAAVIDCIGSCKGNIRLPGIMLLGYVAAHSENLAMAVIISKSKKAIKNILQKCTYLPALEPFLYDAPPNILKHVVGQFSKVLPHDSKARRLFVTSGGLKKVQEIKAEPGSLLQEYINSINNCYPEEIVRYYSPGYSETLLQRVDSYQPLTN
ncbi:hypothetical protein G4228_015429 [Cervus hanglu yarkandensis]|nr:hypothetical protein G4228_015429 [Cervus hanglu yarkandensis]